MEYGMTTTRYGSLTMTLLRASGAVLMCFLAACSTESRFETVRVPSDHKWPPPGWIQQNPSTKEALNGSKFINPQKGWIVGTHGLILTTADGGSSWQEQTSGTERHLSAVTFVDELRGWAVGEASTILHTTDGGQTWGKQGVFQGFEGNAFPSDDIHLHKVFCLNAEKGWAVGWTFLTEIKGANRNISETRRVGVILGTSNGGNTWHLQHAETSELVGEIRSLWFLTDSLGWAVGDNGKVLRTSDGGLHWVELSKIPNVYLSDVFFADLDRGWVLANSGPQGQIFMTIDGGRTWNTQSQLSRSLSRICFASAASGWVVGEYGVIFHTLDGGATWQPQISGVNSALRGVECVDEKTSWILGQYGAALKTTDGGEHWSAQFNATTQSLRGVTFINETTGWAVGDKGSIVTTIDGGHHWQRQTSPIDNNLQAVAFASTTHGWAVGEKGTILATTDAGRTWHKQESRIGEGFSGVSFVNATQGWVVGTHGTILMTRNGGTTWELLNRGGGSQPFADWNNFFSVTFQDQHRGWIVGHNGTIVHTRDGGHSLEEQYGYSKRGNVGFLFDVSFPTPNHGWAVGWQMLGGKSVIMATTNGGKTWEFQCGASVHTGHDGILRGVAFVDSKTGWAVGGQGAILKTTNGGRTWITRVPKVAEATHTYDFIYGPELYDAHFINGKIGWVVGENGTILKTSTGGE